MTTMNSPNSDEVEAVTPLRESCRVCGFIWTDSQPTHECIAINFTTDELNFYRSVFRLCYEIVVKSKDVPGTIPRKALTVMASVTDKFKLFKVQDHGPDIYCPHAGKHHFLLCQLIEIDFDNPDARVR